MRAERAAIYTALLLVAWGTYWLAFFPGVVNHDVVMQRVEMLSGRYGDVHPALHTLFLRLLLGLYPSFGVVSGVHVTIAAVLAGYLAATACELGAPPWATSATVLWLSLVPVFGLCVIGVGRDTTFALAVVATTVLLLRLAARRVLTVAEGVVLGLVLAAVWLLRHNGPAVVLPVLVIFAIRAQPSERAGLAGAALACALAVLAVRGPLYRAVGVAPMSPVVDESFLMHQVAGLLHARTPLTPDEAAFLEEIAPLAVWRSTYGCADSYAFLFDTPLHLEPLERDRWRLVQVWAALARRNPGALVRHWRCVTAFVRRLHSPLRIGPLSPQDSTVAPNDLGIGPRSQLPAVQHRLAQLVRTTMARRGLRAILWQPGFSLLLLVGSLAVALARARSAAPLLVWMPALCNTLVWLAGMAPTPHVRYQWPAMLLAPLLVCVSMICWRAFELSARRPGSSTPASASFSAAVGTSP